MSSSGPTPRAETGVSQTMYWDVYIVKIITGITKNVTNSQIDIDLYKLERDEKMLQIHVNSNMNKEVQKFRMKKNNISILRIA